MTADAAEAATGRISRALDLSNFFRADVRDGLGPYLSIYPLLTHHWDQASIGFVMGIGGIAAIAARTPVGALVDRTFAKRALIVAAGTHRVAFFSLGIIAAAGLVLYAAAMPETGREAAQKAG